MEGPGGPRYGDSVNDGTQAAGMAWVRHLHRQLPANRQSGDLPSQWVAGRRTRLRAGINILTRAVEIITQSNAPDEALSEWEERCT